MIKKLFTAIVVSLVLCLLPITAFAKKVDLVSTKHSILTLQEMQKQDILTQAETEKGIQYYLSQAKESSGRNITLKEVLETSEPTLTPLQQFAGLISVFGVLEVLGIILLVISFAYIFKRFEAKMLRLLQEIPIVVYEFSFYLFSIGLFIGGLFTGEPVHTVTGTTSALLFAAALGFSFNHRSFVHEPFTFSGILFMVWTAAAIIYGNSIIGFLAIAALLCTIGYNPLYASILREEKTVERITLAAFSVLVIFCAIRILGKNIPVLANFETGALYLGSIIGFIGLILLSTRWYKIRNRAEYIVFQLLAVSTFITVGFVGGVFQIGALLQLSGTFFLFYFMEKWFEIRTDNKLQFAILCFFGGLIMIGVSVFIFSHQELVRSFLLIPN